MIHGPVLFPAPVVGEYKEDNIKIEILGVLLRVLFVIIKCFLIDLFITHHRMLSFIFFFFLIKESQTNK